MFVCITHSCYNQTLLFFLFGNGKEVAIVRTLFITFMLSVAAGVIANYISKWLDRSNK